MSYYCSQQSVINTSTSSALIPEQQQPDTCCPNTGLQHVTSAPKRSTDFSPGKKSVARWQQKGKCGFSVQVYVQNRRCVSPCIQTVEAFQWMSTVVRVIASTCVHLFLFLSGETWCWNIRKAASCFRNVLSKSIENISEVFPFQKWTAVLWRRPPSRKTFHLQHWGHCRTYARNH